MSGMLRCENGKKIIEPDCSCIEMCLHRKLGASIGVHHLQIPMFSLMQRFKKKGVNPRREHSHNYSASHNRSAGTLPQAPLQLLPPLQNKNNNTNMGRSRVIKAQFKSQTKKELGNLCSGSILVLISLRSG